MVCTGQHDTSESLLMRDNWDTEVLCVVEELLADARVGNKVACRASKLLMPCWCTTHVEQEVCVVQRITTIFPESLDAGFIVQSEHVV